MYQNKELMDTEKLYTIELKKVLTLVSKDILSDYPAKKITSEHFILGLLNSKQCSACKLLNNIMEKNNFDNIYNFYAKYLNEKSVPLMPTYNNEKTVGYDNVLTKYIIDAEAEKTKLSDSKISSEHVLLSILNSDNNIKKQFENAGVTYDIVYNEISTIRSNNIKKDDEYRALANTISGLNSKSNNKKNVLEQYCVNLNTLSQQGKIDNLVGRKNEINRIIKIIGRRNRNNIVFVGLPGVGKTAIVYGLANMIEQGNAMFLNGKTILSLNMTAIIAGTTYRGMLEDRMNNIISEIKNNKDYILFIDDIHTVLNNGNNSSELSGILTNALSDGDIQLLATTSFKEYKNSIESNTTLSRRFQKIIIDPASSQETEEILSANKIYYEKYHNVKYTDEAIKACISLANKYITERQLPDSAIDIMDECGSEKKVYNQKNDELVSLRKELINTEKLKNKSMKENDFKNGDIFNKKCKEIQSKIIDFEKKSRNVSENDIKEISEIDVYSTVAEMTGIPLTKLSSSEKQKFLNIENILNSNIIGQEEAIQKVSQTIKRNRMGLGRKNKPVGVFLCIGESGVGKTLLAKKLAEEIYGGENYLVRFDMSEYADKTSVNKLIGAGSGYVGYEQGGQLTETIKNNKYCVLLLDEIEKANKEILNIFLQVFDEGFLSDNTGQKISFKNVIILMTSNIGAKEAASFSRSAGFISNVEENKKNISEKALKEHFSPELLNRLDSVVYFKHLDDDNMKKIIKLELNGLNKMLNDINYGIDVDDQVIDIIFDIVKKSGGLGARPINRAIQNEIENKICDLYLNNEYEDNHIFKVIVDDGKIKID